MYKRRFTAHHLQAMRQYAPRVLLPTTPQQSGSVQQELHCPLPLGGVAFERKDPHYPLPIAMWQHTEGSQPPKEPAPKLPNQAPEVHRQQKL